MAGLPFKETREPGTIRLGSHLKAQATKEEL
jgi:hypothetical protein